MAGFKGIVWAPKQLAWALGSEDRQMLAADAGTYAVSRSIHYGLFLAFEGIRFRVQQGDGGRPEVVFVNVHLNLERFRSGISYNLGDDQQHLVPGAGDLLELFLGYLGHPSMRGFLQDMATTGAQGYLRPFTVDDSQSIGVTFPSNPAIRVVAARYDSYLGEPFHGVVVPHLVRAVGVNGTGCLKLGVNYLLSVKAVQAAKRIRPGAGAALFLDDQTHLQAGERLLTEWDSSCCLVALRDGTVVRIPDGPLILPSITIAGIHKLLLDDGVRVEERDLSYAELVERGMAGEVVAVCSVGTAGILGRCASLLLVNDALEPMGEIEADPAHGLHEALGDIREAYWGLFTGERTPPAGMERTVHAL